MDALGEGEVELDSLLVLAQAFPKALSLIVGDLGEEGLGKLGTDYCVAAADAICGDAERVKQELKGGSALM